MLVNTVDNLQAINTNLAAKYALRRDIDASSTAGWNGGAGFVPIGAQIGGAFNGIFDGQDHIISGLVINRRQQIMSDCSDFRWDHPHVGLVGESITGGYYVGGLAGASGGTARLFPRAYHKSFLHERKRIGQHLRRRARRYRGRHNQRILRNRKRKRNDYVGGLVGANSAQITQAMLLQAQQEAENISVDSSATIFPMARFRVHTPLEV